MGPSSLPLTVTNSQNHNHFFTPKSLLGSVLVPLQAQHLSSPELLGLQHRTMCVGAVASDSQIHYSWPSPVEMELYWLSLPMSSVEGVLGDLH